LKITFFNNQNVDGITCFSNEGEDWHQTKTELEGNVLKFFSVFTLFFSSNSTPIF